MIIKMPDTTTDKIEARLIDLKQRGNAVALGRVLTLVILNDDVSGILSTSRALNRAGGSSEPDCDEAAIKAANEASREHPSRILSLTGAKGEGAKLDAEVRIGGDAGASEVVVLTLTGELRKQTEPVITPLLVPDAPIVAWWPHRAPAIPSQDQVGRIAKLRITDAASSNDGHAVLESRAAGYQPGDTDLAWTRLTGWRAQLAAALDLPPAEAVKRAQVVGDPNNASVILLAGWLAVELGCPVVVQPVADTATSRPGHSERNEDANATCIRAVTLSRKGGDVVFERPDANTLTIAQPGFPRRCVALPRLTLGDALIEELRRLDADRVYEKALKQGVPLVTIAHDSSQRH